MTSGTLGLHRYLTGYLAFGDETFTPGGLLDLLLR